MARRTAKRDPRFFFGVGYCLEINARLPGQLRPAPRSTLSLPLRSFDGGKKKKNVFNKQFRLARVHINTDGATTRPVPGLVGGPACDRGAADRGGPARGAGHCMWERALAARGRIMIRAVLLALAP